jgi:hypothetical protein
MEKWWGWYMEWLVNWCAIRSLGLHIGVDMLSLWRHCLCNGTTQTKKRAEHQTATIVKKSATLNMGNKITQALAGEPPVTHAIMASLIDERIKTHGKQTAKLIATEARKKSSGGGGTNPKHPDKQQEKTGQKQNSSLKHTNPSKKPRRLYIPLGN